MNRTAFAVGTVYDYEAGVDLYDASEGRVEPVIYQICLFSSSLDGWGWTITRHGEHVRTEGNYATREDAQEDAQEECEALVRMAYADYDDPREEWDYRL